MRLIRHLTRGDLYPGMDGIDLHHRMNFVVFLFFVLVNQIPVPLAPLCGAEVVGGCVAVPTLLTVMESQNTASKFSDSSVVELFFDALSPPPPPPPLLHIGSGAGGGVIHLH